MLPTLQACDRCLVSKLPNEGTDWADWLDAADRMGMPLLRARCAKPVLFDFVTRPCGKKHMVRLGSLSHAALQVLLETTLKAARHSPYMTAELPDSSTWQKPGDLFLDCE
jgi:hypothetical protein